MWRRSTLRLYVFSIRLLSVAEAPPHFFSPSLYRRHIVASLRFLNLSVQTRVIASLHFLTLAILIHPVIERWLVSVVEPSRNAGFIFPPSRLYTQLRNARNIRCCKYKNNPTNRKCFKTCICSKKHVEKHNMLIYKRKRIMHTAGFNIFRLNYF